MAIKGEGLVTVTYKPLDRREIDPVKYGGIEFPVNEPVLLDPKNRKHMVQQMLAKEAVNPATGGPMYRHSWEWVFWADALKGNPDFEVEGHERAVREKPVGHVPPPGAQWYDDNAAVIDTR